MPRSTTCGLAIRNASTVVPHQIPGCPGPVADHPAQRREGQEAGLPRIASCPTGLRNGDHMLVMRRKLSDDVAGLLSPRSVRWACEVTARSRVLLVIDVRGAGTGWCTRPGAELMIALVSGAAMPPSPSARPPTTDKSAPGRRPHPGARSHPPFQPTHTPSNRGRGPAGGWKPHGVREAPDPHPPERSRTHPVDRGSSAGGGVGHDTVALRLCPWHGQGPTRRRFAPVGLPVHTAGDRRTRGPRPRRLPPRPPPDRRDPSTREPPPPRADPDAEPEPDTRFRRRGQRVGRAARRQKADDESEPTRSESR